MALKAEVARLNHSRMHWPDRDFVDFLALNAVEIGDAADRRFARRAIPGVMARPIRGMKP